MRLVVRWMAVIVSISVTARAFGYGPEDDPSGKPHLVMIIAEDEYKSEQTLPSFAKANLAEDFRLTFLFADEQDPNSIAGLEALRTANVVLMSIRRRPLPQSQLDQIRAYIAAGKPVVAIRTSCHAFCLRGARPAEGLAEWPEFDQQILGCHYRDHHGNDVPTFVTTSEGASEHPIMRGMPPTEWRVFGSLYRILPLGETAVPLMMGRAADKVPHEPVAWINCPASGNRVFFTSLGHPQDYRIPAFVRLLRDGVYWAAEMGIPDRDPAVLADPPQK